MTHKGTVTLETERLILRRFTTDDAEAVFRNWANDPEVTYFLRWPAHAEISTTQGFVTHEIERCNNDNCYSWGIELKSDKTLIGTIGVVGLREDLRLVQIGYCIGKAWWRRGYASEALKRLIPFFFEEVGANRIESNHDPRNPNSGKVMLKAGLKYEGTLRGADYNNQGICDAAYYAILAEDYYGNAQKTAEPTPSNIATLKTSVDLIFHNLHIAMDTVDWNADVCGAPAWRYIYHTLHSSDKFFIIPAHGSRRMNHLSTHICLIGRTPLRILF